MPDILTQAKGLTKQQVFGNEDLWGDILNGTLDKLDQALGGTLAKPITGAATLSSVEVQNSGFHFTGVLTGDAAIDFPVYRGVAVLRNETTGGFALSCGIRGGLSVTVLNGESAAIWSDGTDFIRLHQASFLSPVAAPAAGIAGRFILFMDVADNALKALGPNGTLTTIAFP